jgi:uncharacterized membrane protein
MVKKFFLFFFILFFLIPEVFSAQIQGQVYDFSLDLVENAIVEIDTVPKQRVVAKDGKYFFNVPEGDFVISARFDGISDKENISIYGDGLFYLDLILIPDFDGDFLDDLDLYFDESYDEFFEDDEKINEYFLSGKFFFFVFLFVFLIFIFFVFFVWKKRGKEDLLKSDEDALLEFLKKENGRALQKNIRKNFSCSEAKVSLLIDDMVSKGKIKKIKKGRGNIIVLR